MNRLSRITFCLLLAGCATLTLERIAVPTGEVWLMPQWRISTGSNARTVEVFVENGTEESVVLSGLALDGVALPALPPERRKKGAPPMPLWWRIATAGDASGRDAPTARPKSAFCAFRAKCDIFHGRLFPVDHKPSVKMSSWLQP